METNELAIEFWGPEQIWEAVEPRGAKRRYPRVEITANGPYTVQPDGPDARPAFFENTTYHVVTRCKLQGKRLSIKHRDPLIEDALHPSAIDPAVVTGTLCFRNQVGLSSFSLLINDNQHLTICLEVFPTKLDYEDDYWDLVAEVSKHVYNLAFEYLRSTYQKAAPMPEHLQRQTDLEWLLLLEHILFDLERAVHHIARQPQRAMVLEPVDCLSAKIKRPDRFVRQAVRAAIHKGHSDAVRADEVPIPPRLSANRPHPSLNTPENRLLRYELVSIRRRLADLYGQVQDAAVNSGQKRFKTAATRIRDLEAKVDQFLQMEPFVSAVGTPPSSYSALVFRAAPGYREAFRCCLTLRLGLRIQADALQLPLKDMGELYEYWCVLTLLEIVSTGSGGTFDPKILIKRRPGGLGLRLRKGRHLLLDVRRGSRTICTMHYNPHIDSATA